jgi:hypothetical protein
MTAPHIRQAGAAEVDAARLLLSRLGVTAEELLTATPGRSPAPTFAAYVPIVSAAVGPGARRVYGSYWNRIVAKWGERRLDELAPSEIRQMLGRPRPIPARRRAGRRADAHPGRAPELAGSGAAGRPGAGDRLPGGSRRLKVR